MVQDGASSIYYEYMYMNGILTDGSIYYKKKYDVFSVRLRTTFEREVSYVTYSNSI